MLTVGVVADLICTFIIFRMYRPIGVAVSAFEGGRELPEAAYATALGALERIPSFLTWFGAIARLVLAAAWGFLNGISTARLLNMLLIEAKLAMRIFDLNALAARRGGRTQTLRARLLASGLALFFFLLAFAGVVFYVRIRGLGALAAAGSLALAQGDRDLAKRVNVVSFDDIGRMTSSFNRILDALAYEADEAKGIESAAEVSAVMDMNRRTVDAIEDLGRVFSTLSSGIQATGAALAAISGSARRNAEEARRDLVLLERMRAFVGDILRSSMAARGSVAAMESAADRLSASQARSGEVNAGLTEGVRSIASAFDLLENSLAGALEGVSALEERVASYRLD